MEARNANRILPGAGVPRSSAAMASQQGVPDDEVVAPNPPCGRVPTHPVEGYRLTDGGKQLPKS